MSVKILYMFILILLLSIAPVLAITGSIGNARMILRVEPGDVIEKSILVKNVNNVSMDIELFASGDLAEDINIQDEKFTLLPEQDKKAYFTIEVKKSGTTESRINVQFKPTDGKNGVGLSSTIIVIAGKSSLFDLSDNDDAADDDTDNNQDDTVNVITGDAISDSGAKTNPAAVIVILTISIFLLLLVILLFLLLKNKKRVKTATKLKKRSEKK